MGGNQIYAAPSSITAEILDLYVHCLEALLGFFMEYDK